MNRYRNIYKKYFLNDNPNTISLRERVAFNNQIRMMRPCTDSEGYYRENAWERELANLMSVALEEGFNSLIERNREDIGTLNYMILRAVKRVMQALMFANFNNDNEVISIMIYEYLALVYNGDEPVKLR